MKSIIKTTHKIFIFSVFVFANFQIQAQNYKHPKSLSRPADFEYLSAPDSNGVRTPRRFPISTKSTSDTKLPYPIIFIHGLVGSSSSWDKMAGFLIDNYGLTDGGLMNYCLNYDGDNSKANTFFAPIPGADLEWWNTDFIKGDFYRLNFDVGIDGSINPNGSEFDCWSNQQAIVKQGIAVKWAIYDVLEKTGCDKVILMGHSMGGLSAREYIQNPHLWQSDGQHHVAKLVTTGTPHGGSNLTDFGIGISEIFQGINEKMDATRDLRTKYRFSQDSGVYLFGGVESNNTIRNSLLSDYYNVDVNCNGVYGETILGLNQKDLPQDIDISCIVGDCPDCFLDATEFGDGVVSGYSANLNNFYDLPYLNLFYSYSSNLIQSHKKLPNQIYENMQGLDEPNNYFFAYEIQLNKTYTGFTTIQSETNPSSFDFDLFKFKLSERKTINVIVDEIKVSDLMINILDGSNNLVGSSNVSNGNSILNFHIELNAGNYFLEISASPPPSDYPFSYNFKIDSENNNYTDVSNFIKENNIIIYPNPTNDIFTIRFSNNGLSNSEFIITDQIGRVLKGGKIQNNLTEIDISNFETGIYFLRIGSQFNQIFKIIKI